MKKIFTYTHICTVQYSNIKNIRKGKNENKEQEERNFKCEGVLKAIIKGINLLNGKFREM